MTVSGPDPNASVIRQVAPADDAVVVNTAGRATCLTSTADPVANAGSARASIAVSLVEFANQQAVLRRFMQRDPIAFGVFEVRNEAIFADAHSRHQCLSAGAVDCFQRGIDLVDMDVDERAVV